MVAYFFIMMWLIGNKCSAIEYFVTFLHHVEGSKSQLPENLQSLTVERLRALLKERGLSVRGKKVCNLHYIFFFTYLNDLCNFIVIKYFLLVSH